MATKTKIIFRVVRQMAKSLIIAGIVIVLSVLVMQVSQTIGILIMLLYSSWMVIQSSRKEMPLSKVTALLPGIMSLTCFLFMLWFLGVHDLSMPFTGLVIGLLPGWLMARGHRIYRKNGILYAKRTYFYILIWAVSVLFIQGSTLLGLRTTITDFGFLLNGFSTAMIMVLSILLFIKAVGKQVLVGGSSASIVFLLATVIAAGTAMHTVEASSLRSGTYVGSMNQNKAHDNHGSDDGKSYVKGGKARVRVNSDGSADLIGEVGCQVKEVKSSVVDGNSTITYKTQFLQLTTHKRRPELGETYGTVHVARYKYGQSAGASPGGFDGSFTGEERETRINKHWQETGIWKIRPASDSSFWLILPNCAEEVFYRGNDWWRLYYEHGSEPGGESPSAPDDLESILDKIKQALPGNGFPEEAIAAGLAIALIQLLAGLGMSAAMSAAQETSAAVAAVVQTVVTAGTQAASSAAAQSAPQTSAQAPPASNVTILDGQEAIDWLSDKKNGFFDSAGNPTKRFHNWMDQAPWSPDDSGLLGFAGDLDDKNKPTGHFAIMVVDKPTSNTGKKSEAPDFWTKLWDSILDAKKKPPQRELELPDKTLDPCVDLRGELTAIVEEGQEFIKEWNANGRKLNQLRLRANNLRAVANSCYVLDATVVIGSLLAGLSLGPLGMIGSAVMLGIVSESIKAGIRECYSVDHASAGDIGGGLGRTGGAQGFAEIVKAQLIKRGLSKSIANGIATKLSVFLSTGNAAYDLRKSMNEVSKIRTEYKQLKAHRENVLQPQLDKLRGQRDLKKMLLEECQQRHGI